MARATRKGWDIPDPDPIPGDIVKCLIELGVDIIRVEHDEANGKCPAHYRRTGKEDRHPSWSVNLETGRHNCFSCGFKGPFISIVREMEGTNTDDAVAWVKARGSIDRAKRLLHGTEGYIQVEEEIEKITEADLALFVPVPRWACETRGLDPDSVDHFGVLWDREKEAWITPIRDPYTFRLWGWQEKAFNGRFFNNYPKHMQKSKTLFGLEQFEGDTAVLVESPLDTCYLDSAEIPGGLSGFGASISDVQIELMVDAGVTTLISALDNDRDGNKANDELRVRCRGRLRLKFWNYGALSAKDPGDMTFNECWESYETAYSSILWKPR